MIVWSAADRVLKNEFISTADEYGISRFERMLNILPSDNDTLESRRARVQAKWFIAIPYTWRKLLEKLASMCVGGFTASIEEYHVKVQVINLTIQFVKEIYGIVLLMLPANMVFLLWIKYGGTYDVALESKTSVEFITSFYPRFNLPLLRLDRRWRLDGSGQRLSGYDSLEQVDLCPVNVGFRAFIDVQVVMVNQTGVSVFVEEVVKISEEIKIRSSSEATIAGAEKMKISMSAEHNLATGDIWINNISCLDGSWYLNGIRKLNGGPCVI